MSEQDRTPDDLARDLRAPGSASELGQEEHYLAMFRAEHGRGAHSADVVPLRSRWVGRIGGSALAAALIVGGGSVAAAVTGSLPEPLQRAAHKVLGPIAANPESDGTAASGSTIEEAVPDSGPASPATATLPPGGPVSPAAPGQPSESPSDPSAPQTSPGAVPSDDPTEKPRTGDKASPAPDPKPQPPEPKPDPKPSPAPTPQPSPEPDPPAPAEAGAVTIAAPTHRVPPGSTVTFSGVVTATDGAALDGVRVALQRRVPRGWRPVASTTSAADGSVAITSPPIQQTSGFRLRTKGAHSQPWRTRVQATLSATVDRAPRNARISAFAQGAQGGDAVALLTRRNGTLVRVQHATLAPDGSVAFDVALRPNPQRFVVLLRGTKQHTPARVVVRVPVART